MKIDQLLQKTTISAIENLHFIMMHKDDKQLQKECKQMIRLLHEKELFPAMEFHSSFSKDSDRAMP